MKRHPTSRRNAAAFATARPRRVVCELLEPRLLLAGHTCSDPRQDQSDALTSLSLATSGLVRAAEAGSSLATAHDLGSISGARTLGGTVGGSDPSDLVRFTLASPAKLSLGLSGLSADLDLFLYNASGQRITYSHRTGTAAESINVALSQGTYYVGVLPWQRAASGYTLQVWAALWTPPASPAPSAPAAPVAPPPPAAPTTPGTEFPDVAYVGGTNEWGLNAINAPEAWAQGYTGRGTVVAVVDTGVDMSHPDLVSQLWVNADEIAGNGIDDDRNGFVDDVRGWDFAASDNYPDDGNGHGTHVAGTIAAANNGTGATGVAPGARIMPVRVLGDNGSGTVSAVAAGIRYAAQNGADIINLSLGGALSSVIQSAIQYAQQLDVLVVVAAGNESAAAPSYPARFSATMNNVLSVGAHSSSNALAGFSNRVGTSGAVQVDAPGVSVYSTYAGDGYARLSGTSMAAPHVAGLAALAHSANPNLTASQLRSLIVQGASRTISGSEGRGGVNAATSVALAAAGQTASTAVTAAPAITRASAAVTATYRRFAASDGGESPAEQAVRRPPLTADGSPVQSARRSTPMVDLRSSHRTWAARDQALAELAWGAAWRRLDDALGDDEDDRRDTADDATRSALLAV